MNIITGLFNSLNTLTGDFGLSIVIFTIVVKLLMLPLNIKSKKSMNQNKKLSLEVAELKKKYVNEPEKLNVEISTLYQKNIKNSVGILIIFLQMPIFMIMYRLFSSHTINMPTLLTPWIPSLSTPDPLFVLPILFILGQLLPGIVQHFNIIKTTSLPKLSVSTVGMSVVMAMLFVLRLPSGLGLYFVTNTIISSLEQIIIKV